MRDSNTTKKGKKSAASIDCVEGAGCSCHITACLEQEEGDHECIS